MNVEILTKLNKLRKEVSESCYQDILTLIAETYIDKVVKPEEEEPEEDKEKKSCIIKKGSYKISKDPVKI